jgi:hypothetical protein
LNIGQYLNNNYNIGAGDIGKETPDCSVVDVRNSNLKLISTIDFFYPLVDGNYFL